MVALPLSAVVAKGFGHGLTDLRAGLSTTGAVAAIRLTLVMSLATAVVNGLFGTLLAYVLVRFRFPGRGLLAGMADLPFAVPTLVTGVMLVALYGPGSPVGGFLERHGVHIAFAQAGILLALLFVTLPLVVRTVEPVLLELDPAEEEAARVLGPRGGRRSTGSFSPPSGLRSRPAPSCRSPGRWGSSERSSSSRGTSRGRR